MKIRTYPDPVLRKKAEPVENIDESIEKLIDDMAEAMYLDDGVGLAAPQIGVSKRVIVLDAGEGFLSVINPVIVESSGEEEKMEEGCLSLPGIHVVVSRPRKIKVNGLNAQVIKVEIDAQGLIARVLQHEIDHLNGKLLIDYASVLNRNKLIAHLTKKEKVVG